MKSEISVYEVVDIEDLVKIFDAFKGCGTLTFTKNEETMIQFAKKQIDNGHTIVEKRDGAPAGFICFYSNDVATKTGYITAFALDENLGLGKGKTMFRLFREAVRIGSEAGMKNIRLEVAENNTKARKLYEHLGFKYVPGKGDGSFYMEMSVDDFVGRMLRK